MSKETIILVPTTKCDVGCSHCMHDVCADGVDMPFYFQERLIERLLKEKIKADFQLTGLGEPILYPKFNAMTDLILDNYRAEELCLITSGYNHHEFEKRERFLELLQQKHFNKMSLYLSYNLFADFNDRLRALLGDVINSKKSMSIFIKMCMSSESGEETVNQFERCLTRTLKEHSLPSAVVSVNVMDAISKKPDHLKEKMYIVSGQHAEVGLYTLFWSLKKAGRAKMLRKKNTFAPLACDLMISSMDNSVTLCPDGYFYPCDMHVGIHKRRLGHVMENSMESILRKRDIFVDRVRRYLMPIRKHFGIMPCKFCKVLPK